MSGEPVGEILGDTSAIVPLLAGDPSTPHVVALRPETRVPRRVESPPCRVAGRLSSRSLRPSRSCSQRASCCFCPCSSDRRIPAEATRLHIATSTAPLTFGCATALLSPVRVANSGRRVDRSVGRVGCPSEVGVAEWFRRVADRWAVGAGGSVGPHRRPRWRRVGQPRWWRGLGRCVPCLSVRDRHEALTRRRALDRTARASVRASICQWFPSTGRKRCAWRLRRHLLDPVGMESVEGVVGRLGAVQAGSDWVSELSIRTRRRDSQVGRGRGSSGRRPDHQDVRVSRRDAPR